MRNADRHIGEDEHMTPTSDISNAVQRLFGAPDWDAFEKVAFDYFDQNRSDVNAHANFFGYFTPQWHQLCVFGNLTAAEALWRKVVMIARKWEKTTGGRIHKGTPFYFWGGTALLNGNVDMGFLLIHEALNEDMFGESCGEISAEKLPAWHFVTLEDEAQEQYWKPLVNSLSVFLDERILAYNTRCSMALDQARFKGQFLRRRESREAAFFFVYSLWKFKHYIETTQDLNDSSFSILFQLDAILNLYVVLEGILKGYYGGDKTLYSMIVEFSSKHSLGVNQPPSGEKEPRINILEKRFNDDPNGTISAALSYKLGDYTPIQTALSFARLFRNFVAHNIQSYPALQGQAFNLLQLALDAVFSVVELEP
jgi:hypothetical protein